VDTSVIARFDAVPDEVHEIGWQIPADGASLIRVGDSAENLGEEF
jgi:hypothetical protein